MRRALALHRPRPPIWSRDSERQHPARLSDFILALLGVTLLGGLGMMAGLALVGRNLAP